MACQSHLVSTLVTSGSVLPELPQSSIPIRTPQFSLLQEPSTVVVQVCCRTVIWVALVTSSVYLVTLQLPSIETPRPYISEPHSAVRGHNSTQTAIIFVCVDSFIQVLTAKHGMLTLVPVTRSQYTHHRSDHSLSSYKSGRLLQQERLSKPRRSKVVASPCTYSSYMTLDSTHYSQAPAKPLLLL